MPKPKKKPPIKRYLWPLIALAMLTFAPAQARHEPDHFTVAARTYCFDRMMSGGVVALMDSEAAVEAFFANGPPDGCFQLSRAVEIDILIESSGPYVDFHGDNFYVVAVQAVDSLNQPVILHAIAWPGVNSNYDPGVEA
jgi:hypothetical protein